MQTARTTAKSPQSVLFVCGIAWCEVISIMPQALRFSNPIEKKDVRDGRQSSHRNPASPDILSSKSHVKPPCIILIAMLAGAPSGAERKPEPADAGVREA